MGGIMLDSVKPIVIADAIKAKRMWRNMPIRAAAGYLDGAVSEWPAAAFAEMRSLGVAVVQITVEGRPGADVADIENGDMTPVSGVSWALGERKAARFPALYCNRGNKPAVLTEMSIHNLVPGRDVSLWVATLDGSFNDTGGSDLRTEPGVMAVQVLPAASLGIDADASVITNEGNHWLGLDPLWQEAALDHAQAAGRLLREHM